MSDITVFNRAHLRQQRVRHAAKFKNHDFLFEFAADQIRDRLHDIKRDFPLALGLGSRAPNGFFEKLKSLKHIEKIFIADLVDSDIISDPEILPVKPGSIDLIVSNLALHSVNDLPGALSQIRTALKSDGLFIGCMFGGETLYELRQSFMHTEIEMMNGASPRVFPFADKQQMGELMQRAGFALPVIDSEIVRVSYPTMFNLMADLRGMGESNTLASRRKTFTPSGLMAQTAEYYQTNFAEADGRVTASFEIIFLIGWAPHASQPQPLRRGSGEHSLADFLQ